jgi:hypothetical protein
MGILLAVPGLVLGLTIGERASVLATVQPSPPRDRS